MFKILLVGLGNIGCRHLQGICKLNYELAIALVEPNCDNLSKGEKYISTNSKNVNQTMAYTNLSEIYHSSFDLAIIATNSDVRFKIVKDLIENCNIDNFILEKVVFQSISELKTIQLLTELRGSNIYVNFPRRYNLFYLRLSEVLAGRTISMRVYGSNWGFACNSLHFIDLFDMLNYNSEKIELFTSTISREISAKRMGFVEYEATLTARVNCGSEIEISCLVDENIEDVSRTIEINYGEEKIIINEKEEFVSTTDKNLKLPSFKLDYQSDLTTILVNDLIRNGHLKLTSLKSSIAEHEILFRALSGHNGFSESDNFKIT